MKKIFSRIFLAVCVVAGGLLISKPADAQLLFGISFDAKGDVKSTIQQVEQYLATVREPKTLMLPVRLTYTITKPSKPHLMSCFYNIRQQSHA